MPRLSAPYAALACSGLVAALLLDSLVVGTLIVLAVGLLLVGPWLTWSPGSPNDGGSDAESEPESEFALERVLIVSASIGAGHDGAAAEIAREARAAGYAVDQVDFLDLLPLRLGPLMRAAYHCQMRVAPSTWGWALERLQHQSDDGWASTLPTRLARRRVLDACGPRTRVVVSTYPLASQALSGLRIDGSLAIPAITYLTDMSVHPLWVAPGIDAHIALHEIPATAARALGARRVEVLGPKVSPRFRPAAATEQMRARLTFALPQEARLALVVAGSWGVGDIAATVHDLMTTGAATPVVVCGSNTALRRALAARPGVLSFGWVDDMPELMRACDLVIQNAGGLTSLESLASGLPLITYRTLPGHGEMNAEALELAGWSAWARDVEDLSSLVRSATCTTSAVPESPHFPWHRLTGQLALTPA